MKQLLVAAAIAGLLFSFEARAQQRAGSAAIGAVSGAVVLGPVGAVAGAFIGYAAGPAIVHSWERGHSGAQTRSRHTAQMDAGSREAAIKNAPLPVARPANKVATGKTAPPVQGFD